MKTNRNKPIVPQLVIAITGHRPHKLAQLTPTERDQVQRQRVRTARGGVYLFADSVADAVDRFVAIRAEITRRLA